MLCNEQDKKDRKYQKYDDRILKEIDSNIAAQIFEPRLVPIVPID